MVTCSDMSWVSYLSAVETLALYSSLFVVRACEQNERITNDDVGERKREPGIRMEQNESQVVPLDKGIAEVEHLVSDPDKGQRERGLT